MLTSTQAARAAYMARKLITGRRQHLELGADIPGLAAPWRALQVSFWNLVEVIRDRQPSLGPGTPTPAGPVEIRSVDDFADLCVDATIPLDELRPLVEVLARRTPGPPLIVHVGDEVDGRRCVRVG